MGTWVMGLKSYNSNFSQYVNIHFICNVYRNNKGGVERKRNSGESRYYRNLNHIFNVQNYRLYVDIDSCNVFYTHKHIYKT